MLRLLNPRKKFREPRSEDGFYILVKQSRYGGIVQRRDGRYDVYADVPSGQNAFIGTFAGLNGAEAALRHHDKYMASVFRSGRYNPLRRNPVVVKKNEHNRDTFWVNEKKWFTTRERAEAWLAAQGAGSASAPAAAPASAPVALRPAAAPSAPAKVREVIEISDPRSAAYSFSPHRSNTIMYDGTVFPSLEHAFTGIWKRAAADRKSLKRAHWDRAMDMRLFATKGGERTYVKKVPKGKVVYDELLEIVRDLLRNRQLADMLLATGNKNLSYKPEAERLLIRQIENGSIPAKKSRETDGMFLGGEDQMYARALMQVRDELRSNVFRRF